MTCVLLWHVNTHFLYRCSHNISCELIDHSLYICNASLLQTTTSVEKTHTTSIPPEVSTTKIVTSSTSASTPWRTSTPLVTTTTSPSPRPATTTYQPPTSTVALTTLLSNLLNLSTTTETTQLIESLENHTTTDNPSQYLSTSPTFNLTTTYTYTTTTTKTTTSSSSTAPYDVQKTTSVATTTSTESPVTFVNTTTATYRPTTGNPTTKMLRITTGNPTTKMLRTTTGNPTTKMLWTTTENPTTKMLRTTTGNPTTKMLRTTTENPTTSTTVETTTMLNDDPTTTRLYTNVGSVLNRTKLVSTTVGQNLVTTTAIPTVNRTRNLTSFFKKKGNMREEKKDPKIGMILISILSVVIICYVIYWMRRRHAQQSKHKKETTVLPTDEPLDPIIENILEEQDLKNQLRINSWRMAKLHKYLKKKYPEKTVLAKSMEDNVLLMEKIHIQVKNSPVQIYKKRGKKKNSIPTLTADLVPKEDDIPTMKVDLMTALKEPEKVRHISSIAKLRIKMLPVEYEHRRKRKNFKPLKETLLPVGTGPRRPRRKAPLPPKSELDVLKEKKLVSNSVFKKK